MNRTTSGGRGGMSGLFDRSRGPTGPREANRPGRFPRICLLFAAAPLLLLTFLAVSGCATNPATGETQLILINESQEIAMGKEADRDIGASMGIYPETGLQAYLDGLGHELSAASERPKLPWTFRVLDDPTVNAFALPGGYIYVTRGILAYFDNEAQLAGVVGHEIGHVTAKHSVERMSTQGLLQVGLGVGGIVSPELQQYGQLISAGLGVLFLKFSRDDEIQADELGVRYMTRAAYDPRQMIKVMAMLGEVSKAEGGGRIPEWLSTHPDPGNREERINGLLKTQKLDYAKLSVDRDVYLDRVDGIVFGQNPREGYFVKNAFYHPDLEFLFEFPQGWRAVNTKQGVEGLSKEEDALIQLTLRPEKTPEASADGFSTAKGLVVDSRRAVRVNGLDAQFIEFHTVPAAEALQGVAAFISHGGRVYSILGFSVQAVWPSRGPSVTASVKSFSRLTDPKVLSVQPMRIKVVKVGEAGTLEDYYRAHPSPVSLDRIALINQLKRTDRLAPGQRIKYVPGEKLPGA